MIKTEKKYFLKNINFSIMSNLADRVAGALLKIGAVKLSPKKPFTWVSGIKSPIYCDNRMLISHVEERNLVVEAFVEIIKKQNSDLDYVAGTATAAIPWAAFVAQKMEKPMIYIRPEKKEHGAGRQIEGDLTPHSVVLLLEDLISTGGSSLKALAVIEEEGKSCCENIFAIVTYGMKKSQEAFAEAHKKLTTLTDFAHIFEMAINLKLISADERELLQEFIADPPAWGGKNGY